MKSKKLLSLLVSLMVLCSLVSGIVTVNAEYVPHFEDGFESYATADDMKTAGYDLSESGNITLPEITPGDKAMFINKTAASNNNTVINKTWTPLSEGFVVVSTNFMQPSSASVRLQQIWNGTKSLRPCMVGISGAGYLTLKCETDLNLIKFVYGNWYQVATVMDMSQKKVYVYFDGQLINPEGHGFYQAAEDIGRIEIQTNDTKAGSLYVDDIYVDSFSSMEDAYLAIASRNILKNSSSAEYTDSFMANFKEKSDTYLETFASGADSSATDNLTKLVDSAIPSLNKVLFSENFDGYATDASPSSGYVASANNKVISKTIGSSDSNVLQLTNGGSRTRLLKGGINLPATAEISFKFMQETKSEITRLAGAYNSDGKLCAFEMYSNGTGIHLKRTLNNSVPAEPIVTNYEAGTWYDISVKLDYNAHTATAYVNGKKIVTIDFIDNFIENTVVEGGNTYTYDHAPVNRVFDSLNDKAGTYYLENISVNEYMPAPVCIVSKSFFTDADGNSCEKLTPGGTLSSVLVTKNSDTAAMLYTAVFEGDTLADVSFEDISEYDAGTTFEVPVNISVGSEADTVVKQFVWDELTPLTVNTLRTMDAKGSKIIIMGDSTVATYDKAESYPQAGWGEMLSNYLDGNVTVENYAIPGHTLKAGYSNGVLAEALASSRPGDFLLIQYAHNDSKPENSSVYSDAIREYRGYLKLYADSARAKGVTPVFVTSPVRRTVAYFGKNSVLCSYADAMKSVGREMNVPVIDLNTASAELVDCLETGEVGSSKNLYLFVDANDSRYFAEGSSYTTSVYNKDSATEDNTHFCEYGADVMAGLVADGLKSIGFELSERVDSITHVPVMP